MSIPTEHITKIIDDLSQERIINLVNQIDARRILQEVNETKENYPLFDPVLTEKAVHIGYLLLSCGCSLVENEDSQTHKGLELLDKAGTILSNSFKYNANEDRKIRDYNLLVAGMALYAAKQFSRAFIILSDVTPDFTIGQMVTQYIKKEFDKLQITLNRAFFAPPPEQMDNQYFNEWVVTHEIARCFMVIVDFIYTGNDENYANVNEILDKLLILTSESNLTLYWLLVRILRIIFASFHNSSLWSILVPLLPDNDIAVKYIRLLSFFNPPVIEIWPSQAVALPLVLGVNKGAVINLRTSAGKTRVAEISILHTLSTNIMSKVIYLAPFRSLAIEIEQSLNKTFGPMGITVSQLYGGSTVNVTDIDLVKQSQIIIATPEKAKALIRCGTGLEKEVKLIIVDEGHLFGPEIRHIKNEMFLTHLKEYSSQNEIRMILLSAVLPNSKDLAQWIAEDMNLVATSRWKPALERLGLLLWDGNRVRLEWKSSGEPFNPNFIVKAPLGFSRRRNPFPNNKKEAIAATAVRMAQTGTVMIYSARANSIDSLAECVLLALGDNPEDYPWDHSLWNVFYCVCNEELGKSDIILKAAKKGVVCHSNRLPTLTRIAIERLMRSKSPKIIIASSTLGQGVNVGISTVIVSTPYYSDKTISNNDFWNVCGRAGRAFSDVEGKILYAIDTTDETWKVNKNRNLAISYFDSRQMNMIQSGVLIALKEILNIAEKVRMDFSVLIEAIANDTIDSYIEKDSSDRLSCIFDIIDDELLAMHEEFTENETNIDWVESVFRKSLALIQARNQDESVYIDILQARTKALLIRIPNRDIRKRLIASGVPLSVAKAIFDNKDRFNTLALSYILTETETEQLEEADQVIREIEMWSNENASNTMTFAPDQLSLDAIRFRWLSGTTLSEIRQLGNDIEVDKTIKDYYGFTLPWIIHAISQMFDSESEEIIMQTYRSLAMLTELGLPNQITANIYIAGVRSRSAALELSKIDIFNEKTVMEIKSILTLFPFEDVCLSDDSKAWVDLLSSFVRTQASKKVSFPNFTWDQTDIPDKLYLREANGEYLLSSSDGYFYESIESTDELPFHKIANINGLYFMREGDSWRLQSYNPFTVVE